MATALAAFILGTLLGLFARPFLDAYVLWRAAQEFRHEDDEATSAQFEREMNRRSR